MQQYHTVAVLDDASHIMGNHQNGGALFADLFHSPVTFGLEEYVTYRKRLIYDQDLRIYVDSQCKSQTYEHTTGIGLYRLVYEITDLRKIQDILKLCIHLFFRIAHHGTVHVYIFNSGIIHIESGSQFQKCGYFSVYIHLTGRRCQYTGNDL